MTKFKDTNEAQMTMINNAQTQMTKLKYTNEIRNSIECLMIIAPHLALTLRT